MNQNIRNFRFKKVECSFTAMCVLRLLFPLVCLACILSIAIQTGAKPAESEAAPATYLKQTLSLLREQWPTNRTITIVCHGHSVPAGYSKSPLVESFSAYPHLLHKSIKARFPCVVINVIVTAIGGENAEEGARRFEQDVLVLRPDVVTIDYALNDRAIGLARAEAAWNSMITNAIHRGVKVILLTPTPDLAAKLDDPADPLNQHADQIRRLARENGVALADSLVQFQNYVRSGGNLKDLMAQSNHPNGKGHLLVLPELMKWFPGGSFGRVSASVTQTARAFFARAIFPLRFY
ncbi:MAG: lipase [Pedosphaera sp.]|nr:lipase [Pedosphaera sp.]